MRKSLILSEAAEEDTCIFLKGHCSGQDSRLIAVPHNLTAKLSIFVQMK